MLKDAEEGKLTQTSISLARQPFEQAAAGYDTTHDTNAHRVSTRPV